MYLRQEASIQNDRDRKKPTQKGGAAPNQSRKDTKGRCQAKFAQKSYTSTVMREILGRMESIRLHRCCYICHPKLPEFVRQCI